MAGWQAREPEIEPMSFTRALQVLGCLFPVSELALLLVTRARLHGAARRDRGSVGLIWGAVVVGLCGGIALQSVPAGRIPLPQAWLHGMALVLLAGGLVVRWAAILTLGKFFTATVSIRQDHRIIRAGMFRRVRHPSYGGALLAFLGLAIALGNWLSIAAILLPVVAAFLNRIRVEEAALVEALGADYIEYRKSTRCLIPGVF